MSNGNFIISEQQYQSIMDSMRKMRDSLHDQIIQYRYEFCLEILNASFPIVGNRINYQDRIERIMWYTKQGDLISDVGLLVLHLNNGNVDLNLHNNRGNKNE